MSNSPGINRAVWCMMMNIFLRVIKLTRSDNNLYTPSISQGFSSSRTSRITTSTTTVVQSGTLHYDDDIGDDLALDSNSEKLERVDNYFDDDDVYTDDVQISDSNTISSNSGEKERSYYNSDGHPNAPSGTSALDDFYLDDGFYDDSSKFASSRDSTDGYHSKKAKSATEKYSKRRGTTYPYPTPTSYSGSSKSHTYYPYYSPSSSTFKGKGSSPSSSKSSKGSPTKSLKSSKSKGNKPRISVCDRGDYAIRPI